MDRALIGFFKKFQNHRLKEHRQVVRPYKIPVIQFPIPDLTRKTCRVKTTNEFVKFYRDT
jgi:hypothetical protein